MAPRTSPRRAASRPDKARPAGSDFEVGTQLGAPTRGFRILAPAFDLKADVEFRRIEGLQLADWVTG